jgi:hypothetical protein
MKLAEPKWEMRKRENYEGVPSIAPFVRMPNGEFWNVWDIPVKDFTPTVEAAIKAAFWRGVEAARMHVLSALWEMHGSRNDDNG